MREGGKRYKANEPTLNILLPLLNERIFFNNGIPEQVPLISMIAASNEMPEDEEELSALHDRLLFRTWVSYIKDTSNRVRMHTSYVKNRNETISSNTRTTVSLQELEAVRYSACFVSVSKSVINKFNKLLKSINKEGIKVSDRRQNACIKVMQGNALLSGRTSVTFDDFDSLCSILWEREEDIDKIVLEITKYSNPYDNKMKNIKDKFTAIKSILSNAEDDEKTGTVVEAKGKLEMMANELGRLIKEVNESGKDSTSMVKLQQDIINYNQKMMKEELGLDIDL